jgi:hypothetical protein
MAYPGDDKVSSRAEARCDAAFLKYDGTDNPDSMFSYDYIDPDNTTWPAGDRRLVCVAYDATSAHPGGAPVNYSIKGSSGNGGAYSPLGIGGYSGLSVRGSAKS